MEYTAIFIMVGMIILIIFLAVFGYHHMKSQIKKYLKLCIETLGEDLESSLIVNASNPLNTAVYNYLKEGSEANYKKVSDILIAGNSSFGGDKLTMPGYVMNLLLCTLITEQLRLKYSKGFTFCKYTFDNLEHIAPIIKNYCVVYKLPFGTYYTNILRYELNSNIVDLLKMRLKNYLIRNIMSLFFDCDEHIILPKKILVLYESLEQRKDYIRTRNRGINLPSDFEDYKLSSMVFKSSYNDYELVKGLNLENQSPETIRENYRVYRNSSLGIGIFEKRI